VAFRPRARARLSGNGGGSGELRWRLGFRKKKGKARGKIGGGFIEGFAWVRGKNSSENCRAMRSPDRVLFVLESISSPSEGR
jgi:hypothetical protein